LKKIISVGGARPNFMKIAPIYHELKKYKNEIQHMIVHTGQHYDEKMSQIFFDELELPKPDFFLGVGSGTHSVQTARIMVEFEKVLVEQKPDLVIVVGDVNSTVACSLVCSKMMIPLVHVEAGLRSFDNTMPEEINRKVTDTLSDLLFVTEPSGMQNLKNEGVDPKKYFLVGDVMIDSLVIYQEKSKKSKIVDELGLNGEDFILVTLHRPSNVDSKDNLEKIAYLFEQFSKKAAIVFPVHPRTKKMISNFGLDERFNKISNLKLVDPVGYMDFLSLMSKSALILTDSGGIQEETTFLGIPCLTLRENTERPVTIEVGTNYLVGLDLEKVISIGFDILNGKKKTHRLPDLWDGKAAERIVKIIYNYLFKTK
jgi:UDP-N-acetylglucosamine 2-epimerase (non-hydrolysing)